MKQGMYSAIPEADYHRDPCNTPSASASILATLYLESPLHAWTAHPKLNSNWRPSKSTPEQAFGRAAHAMLLGNAAVEVVGAADWRTKGAKQAREEIEQRGGIPVLAAKEQVLLDMIGTLRDGLEKHDLGNPFEDGHAEATAIWYDDEKPLRARCDYWNPKRKLIVDLKTVSGSASPDRWASQLFAMGSDFQAVLYPMGVQDALGLAARPDFVFIVVETSPPFAFSVIRLSATARELAENKVVKAWHQWRTCLDQNRWPGYPTGICEAHVPAWEARAEAEREALGKQPEGVLLQ